MCSFNLLHTAISTTHCPSVDGKALSCSMNPLLLIPASPLILLSGDERYWVKGRGREQEQPWTQAWSRYETKEAHVYLCTRSDGAVCGCSSQKTHTHTHCPQRSMSHTDKQERSKAARWSETELSLQLDWEDTGTETMLHNCSSCLYQLQCMLHVIALSCQHVTSFWLLRGKTNVCTFGEIICFLWRLWLSLCRLQQLFDFFQQEGDIPWRSTVGLQSHHE